MATAGDVILKALSEGKQDIHDAIISLIKITNDEETEPPFNKMPQNFSDHCKLLEYMENGYKIASIFSEKIDLSKINGILNFSKENISSDIIIWICKEFNQYKYTHVNCLSFEGCQFHFTEKEISLLLDLLKSNPTIKTLDLRDNHFNLASEELIEDFLKTQKPELIKILLSDVQQTKVVPSSKYEQSKSQRDKPIVHAFKGHQQSPSIGLATTTTTNNMGSKMKNATETLLDSSTSAAMPAKAVQQGSGNPFFFKSVSGPLPLKRG